MSSNEIQVITNNRQRTNQIHTVLLVLSNRMQFPLPVISQNELIANAITTLKYLGSINEIINFFGKFKALLHLRYKL